MLPVQLRGIDPALEPGVTSAATSLIEGRLADLEAGANGVIVGSVIAQQLALVIGDRLNLLVPGVSPTARRSRGCASSLSSAFSRSACRTMTACW